MRTLLNHSISRLLYLLQSAYLSSKGFAVSRIRAGANFRAISRQLEDSQWFSEGEFENLQDERLRELVRHAYDHVPFYRTQFKAHGLRPDDIRSRADLTKIPCVTRQDIQRAPDKFVADNVNRHALAPGWTTGSSGSPLNILRSVNSINFENAILWRQRHWAGISETDRNSAVWGTIWNDVIVPSWISEPPYWRRNLANRQLLLSYNHMSDRTLPRYVQMLGSFKPAFIESFPSVLLQLAAFVEPEELSPALHAVFTSSEPLFPVHREQIEARFSAPVFDHYGQAERVVAASECDAHDGLHLLPEYGIAELLASDGSEAAVGESGELVGTSFHNFAMPLIRYRTGDLAVRGAAPCSCGRKMPLITSIEGRISSMLHTSDGRRIPGNAIMAAFHGVENVARSQIEQFERGSIRISIQRTNLKADFDTDKLTSNLRRAVGEGLECEVNLVNSLATGSGGKYHWVISHIEN